jgi:hypothetical protein
VTTLATGQYHSKEKNTTAQQIVLVQLVVGKYKKIERVDNKNKNKACGMQMMIEHALLHPSANRTAQASSTYNAWKPENTLNWWGTFGDRVPLTRTCERVEQESLQ